MRRRRGWPRAPARLPRRVRTRARESRRRTPTCAGRPYAIRRRRRAAPPPSPAGLCRAGGRDGGVEGGGGCKPRWLRPRRPLLRRGRRARGRGAGVATGGGGIAGAGAAEAATQATEVPDSGAPDCRRRSPSSSRCCTALEIALANSGGTSGARGAGGAGVTGTAVRLRRCSSTAPSSRWPAAAAFERAAALLVLFLRVKSPANRGAFGNRRFTAVPAAQSRSSNRRAPPCRTTTLVRCRRRRCTPPAVHPHRPATAPSHRQRRAAHGRAFACNFQQHAWRELDAVDCIWATSDLHADIDNIAFIDSLTATSDALNAGDVCSRSRCCAA